MGPRKTVKPRTKMKNNSKKKSTNNISKASRPSTSGIKDNKIKNRITTNMVNLTQDNDSDNQFEVLSDYDGMSMEEIISAVNTKKAKIPPIIIYTNLNYSDINKLKALITGDIKVKYRGNRSNVYTENMSDYNKIMQYAKEMKLDHYTHTPQDKKELKLVLKNISPYITEEEIRTELSLQQLSVIRVKQMIKKDNNIKLPLFVITFAVGTLKSQVFSIKYVCNCVIQWEAYRSNNPVVQCYKCQGFNHLAKNCYKKPKCFKCSLQHNTSECPVTSSDNYKCANCEKSHAANNKSCEVYIKVLQSKTNKPVQKSKSYHSAKNSETTIIQATTSAHKNTELYSEKLKTNKPSANGNNVEPSISEVLLEIKDLFHDIDIAKFKSTFISVYNKIKNTNSTVDKLCIIAEGLFELFSDG